MRPELVRDLGEAPADLLGGAHGAQGVILVHARDAEHRKHGVPGVLLNCAAVALDRRPDRLETAAEHPMQCLRIEFLAERGRADEIAEQRGYNLAGITGRARLRKLGTAGPAEPEAARVLGGAGLADGHLVVRRPCDDAVLVGDVQSLSPRPILASGPNEAGGDLGSGPSLERPHVTEVRSEPWARGRHPSPPVGGATGGGAGVAIFVNRPMTFANALAITA